jgi:hypothetical protein
MNAILLVDGCEWIDDPFLCSGNVEAYLIPHSDVLIKLAPRSLADASPVQVQQLKPAEIRMAPSAPVVRAVPRSPSNSTTPAVQP